MNKIFKVIWNPATGNYTVASETAKGRGKKSGSRKLFVSALVAGGMLSSFGAIASFSGDGGKISDPTELSDSWIAIGKDSKASSTGGGTGAVALGVEADASGVGATALGFSTKATGEKSVAIGQLAEATGSRAIGIGSGAEAFGDYGIAMGLGAKAHGHYSIVFGRMAAATAENAIALGNEAQANGLYSLAMGSGSIAYADNTIAFGNQSHALEAGAIVMGQGSEANGINAITLGNGSLSGAENAIALGQGSKANTKDSIAIGSQATVRGINAVALGAGSEAKEDDTVSVGNSTTQRKIVNMAKGTIAKDSTEAINGSQVYDISKSVADRLGGGASVNTNGVINAPNYSLKSGTFSTVGDAFDSLDKNTLQWDKLKGVYSASHGSTATNNIITNVKAGDVSDTSTDAVNGSQLKTTNDNVQINADNITNLTSDVAGNTTSITNLTNDVAGNTTNITNLTDDVADINNTITTLSDDALLWDGTAFSAAHGSNTTNKITNVAAGELSDISTDAVNGSQLKTTNDNVQINADNITNLTSDVAGNTTSITNLTNDVAGNTTSITNLTDDVADINNTITTLGDDSLRWDSTAFSAAHGTDTTNKITNVAAGELSDASTDAVNGSQLKTTNDNVTANTTSITNLSSDVAGNTTSITNLTNDVAGNTTSITNLTEDVADINNTITTLGDDSLRWDSTAFSAAHGTDATSKITNVANGDISNTSTDAINGSQLYGVSDFVVDSLGGNAALNADGSFTAPTFTIAGNDYTNVGEALEAINSSMGASLGDALLWDTDTNAFSAKHGSTATSKITNLAAGSVAEDSTDAINGGQLYGVSTSVAEALGGGSTVNSDGSITGPTYSIANNEYTSIGDAFDAIDSTLNSTLDDALLWDTDANAFSASRGGQESKITNVAAGSIAADSTDAVNGGQLYGVSNSVVEALGGGATMNADGSISAPTYSIADTNYNNVGDALDAIDSTLDDALLWDATAGENGAFSASREGKASVITNVANGDISETSTDAINGSQLFATNTLINQQNEIINQIAGNTSVDYIEENGAGLNYARTNDAGLTFMDASASGAGATAVGYNAVASGESSVAIGQNSSSSVDTGIALGSNSVSKRGIAQGSRDTSVTEEGVVIGYDTTDGELLGALSIGDDGKYRQIINVADGSEAHDAVTVRQLQNAIGAVATTPSKYFHANSTEEDSLAVGTDSLAMGAKTIVNADAGIGIGLNTLVLADAINGIAIGSNARANHANSIAMGNGSQTTRGAQTGYTAYNMDAPQNSVGEFSVGSEDGQRQITNVAAGSADTDAVNVGQLKVTDAQVSQNTQSITNLNTQVTNLDTRVTNIENGIGDIVTTGSTRYFKTNTDGVDANAQGKDSVAIGSGSIAAADNSVALGTGSVANEENTISVGSSTNQRRITNVAAGKNATDAVNVAQLKSSEAGGVRYDTKADGSIDYSNITLGGGNGGTTRISNVSAGVNNNDAVNYAQLKQSVQETKQYTDQRMVEMDNKLSKTESKLSGGIASAMAMTGLPQAYTPGASMASIGGGTYNGESAVALGVSMVSANGRWVYKLQGSTNSQGEYSAALGAGIQW
ncbi:YadA-like family protein [Escherichia coli]|nr:YadA-like family protein [Escherichia coli]WFW64853.1 YadA-like family protein [Escherichia coli]